jgi:Tfp pilus assembly protein PilX
MDSIDVKTLCESGGRTESSSVDSFVRRAPLLSHPSEPEHRRGMALLLCMFVVSIVTVWLVDMLDSATVNQSALRNTIEYEQALYLANAGVHHAVAQLEQDTSWRSTVTDGSYPASGSYSATAVNGAVSGTVDITSYGVSGQVTRKLQATVQVN